MSQSHTHTHTHTHTRTHTHTHTHTHSRTHTHTRVYTHTHSHTHTHTHTHTLTHTHTHTANPACDKIGCGEWKPPMIQNPDYKGKWKPPLIDNPDFMVSTQLCLNTSHFSTCFVWTCTHFPSFQGWGPRVLLIGWGFLGFLSPPFFLYLLVCYTEFPRTCTCMCMYNFTFYVHCELYNVVVPTFYASIQAIIVMSSRSYE